MLGLQEESADLEGAYIREIINIYSYIYIYISWVLIKSVHLLIVYVSNINRKVCSDLQFPSLADTYTSYMCIYIGFLVV